MIDLASYDSPLGTMILTAEHEKICGVWFEGQKYALTALQGKQIHENETPVLQQAETWLDRYFAGENPVMDLPILPAGTPFQMTVWQILQEIPYGSTWTYQQVAAEVCRRLDRPRMSCQAVGQAVGHNPVSILIPCHRVLGSDGSLTGYAGGVERKKALLELEGSSILI